MLASATLIAPRPRGQPFLVAIPVANLRPKSRCLFRRKCCFLKPPQVSRRSRSQRTATEVTQASDNARHRSNQRVRPHPWGSAADRIFPAASYWNSCVELLDIVETCGRRDDLPIPSIRRNLVKAAPIAGMLWGYRIYGMRLRGDGKRGGRQSRHDGPGWVVSNRSGAKSDPVMVNDNGLSGCCSERSRVRSVRLATGRPLAWLIGCREKPSPVRLHR
jgi:hypothetical protein